MTSGNTIASILQCNCAQNEDTGHARKALEMREKEPIGAYELFMLGLCVYVLIAMAASTFISLSADAHKIVNAVDTVICFVFIADFVYKLTTAKSKAGYLKWGWIDLISSIPMVDFLRWGRIARVVRILRLLRVVRSAKRIVAQLAKQRGEATFLALGLAAVVLMVISSIAILQVEHGEGANIKDASDALWWAFVTVTTVGYGDKFPVTTEGRIIAGVLMLIGVGLFGTFTGLAASWFMGPEEREQEDILEAMSKRMERIERMLENLSRQQVAENG